MESSFQNQEIIQEATTAIPVPTAKVNWPVAIVLLGIHLAALAAFLPAFFHWHSVVLAFILAMVTGVIGINLCFHRLLTHRSFHVPKLVEYFMATLGTLSLEGSPFQWVATHRIHHAFTDTEKDPHDANKGFLWTHILWLFMPNKADPDFERQKRYAPDLWEDRYYRFLHYFTLPLQLALGLVLFLLGGWSWVIWGMFVRLVFVYHVTWLVNSASHKFGYQTYDTHDKSTNCWWVGLLAWGEGWHNNHHKFPYSARHGLKWYELDVSWLLIRAMQVVKLASKVKLPKPIHLNNTLQKSK